MRLGRFLLVKELGKGATGTAYLAEDEQRRTLCVKILHPTTVWRPEAMQRVRREILLTQRIAHPAVCRLFDIGVESGQTYVTMEYAEGESLHQLLKREGALPVDRALAIAVALCGALTAAHDQGVIHRDLKPGNIVVDKDHDVKLLDFGLATADDLKSSLTAPGSIIGTRSFIAPEVWQGNPATAKSDQYAVGVILYKMLTGQLPYPQKDAFLLDAMMKTKPPLPRTLRPEIPPLVEAVLMRVLEYDPARRFEDVRALGLVLLRARADRAKVTAVSAPRTSPPAPDAATPANPAALDTLIEQAMAAGLPPISDEDSESGSWIVNGRATGAPVQPKMMEVPVAPLATALEPEELPVWRESGGGRRALWIGVVVVVVVALAIALAMFVRTH